MVNNAPHSGDAERALLSCMLMSERALAKALNGLDGSELFHLKNADIFKVISELFNEGTPIEEIAVSDRLKRHGKFDTVGGYSYIGDLVDFVPDDNSIDTWIDTIKSTHVLRNLDDACYRIQREVREGNKPSEEVVAYAESQIYDVTSGGDSVELKDSSDILSEVLDSLHERVDSGGGIQGVQTGFSKLDRLTGGLKRGHLVVVAGRPAMGKTSFALNIALHASIVHGYGVAVFSLEMDEVELVERMVSMQGGVSSQRMGVGKLTDDEFKMIANASGLINRAPIYINDSASITTMQIRANLMRQMSTSKIDLVVVDYLQLMAVHGKQSREQEVATISRELKVVARDLRIPIIAISQLNRATESRTDARPQLSDLRESGAIEQDADIVMFVFREEEYTGPRNKRGEDVEGVAELILRKQRNGPTGKITMTFEKEFTRFVERDGIANAREIGYPVVEEVTDLPFEI